ncbi:hypothetical protein JMUB7497_27120 [Staphylococcus aureus]
MKSKGMVLYMNRNTKTTTGKYIVSETLHDEDGRPKSKDKEYPVKMVDNKIIPTKGLKDENIKKELENFKFFAQYGSFKDLWMSKNGVIPKIQSYRVIQQNIN